MFNCIKFVALNSHFKNTINLYVYTDIKIYMLFILLYQ